MTLNPDLYLNTLMSQPIIYAHGGHIHEAYFLLLKYIEEVTYYKEKLIFRPSIMYSS